MHFIYFTSKTNKQIIFHNRNEKQKPEFLFESGGVEMVGIINYFFVFIILKNKNKKEEANFRAFSQQRQSGKERERNPNEGKISLIQNFKCFNHAYSF